MNNKSNKLFKRAVVAAGIVLGIIFFVTPTAKAITLIPPQIEVGLKPGTEYNTVIKLFNETEKTISLYTEARSFTAKGETGQPEFDFDSEPSGISTWMNVEEGPIVLAPGERYQVPLVISPPQNADPGGHYAAVFFSSSPPETGQVTISTKVGTLVLARVDGEIVEQGSIVGFDTSDGKSSFNRPPVEMFARFQNSGNVHLRPAGTVEVKNMFGKVSDSIEFNASRGATLPDTTRKYDIVWEKAQVGDTTGNAWSSFWKEYSNEWDNFALGKYTATLSVTAGSTDSVTDTASISFWIFPWRVLVIWGLIVIAGIFLLIVAFKKYNAWIVRKSKSK